MAEFPDSIKVDSSKWGMKNDKKWYLRHLEAWLNSRDITEERKLGFGLSENAYREANRAVFRLSRQLKVSARAYRGKEGQKLARQHAVRLMRQHAQLRNAELNWGVKAGQDWLLYSHSITNRNQEKTTRTLSNSTDRSMDLSPSGCESKQSLYPPLVTPTTSSKISQEFRMRKSRYEMKDGVGKWINDGFTSVRIYPYDDNDGQKFIRDMQFCLDDSFPMSRPNDIFYIWPGPDSEKAVSLATFPQRVHLLRRTQLTWFHLSVTPGMTSFVDDTAEFPPVATKAGIKRPAALNSSVRGRHAKRSRIKDPISAAMGRQSKKPFAQKNQQRNRLTSKHQYADGGSNSASSGPFYSTTNGEATFANAALLAATRAVHAAEHEQIQKANTNPLIGVPRSSSSSCVSPEGTTNRHLEVETTLGEHCRNSTKTDPQTRTHEPYVSSDDIRSPPIRTLVENFGVVASMPDSATTVVKRSSPLPCIFYPTPLATPPHRIPMHTTETPTHIPSPSKEPGPRPERAAVSTAPPDLFVCDNATHSNVSVNISGISEDLKECEKNLTCYDTSYGSETNGKSNGTINENGLHQNVVSVDDGSSRDNDNSLDSSNYAIDSELSGRNTPRCSILTEFQEISCRWRAPEHMERIDQESWLETSKVWGVDHNTFRQGQKVVLDSFWGLSTSFLPSQLQQAWAMYKQELSGCNRGILAGAIGPDKITTMFLMLIIGQAHLENALEVQAEWMLVGDEQKQHLPADAVEGRCPTNTDRPFGCFCEPSSMFCRKDPCYMPTLICASGEALTAWFHHLTGVLDSKWCNQSRTNTPMRIYCPSIPGSTAESTMVSGQSIDPLSDEERVEMRCGVKCDAAMYEYNRQHRSPRSYTLRKKRRTENPEWRLYPEEMTNNTGATFDRPARSAGRFVILIDDSILEETYKELGTVRGTVIRTITRWRRARDEIKSNVILPGWFFVVGRSIHNGFQSTEGGNASMNLVYQKLRAEGNRHYQW